MVANWNTVLLHGERTDRGVNDIKFSVQRSS